MKTQVIEFKDIYVPSEGIRCNNDLIDRLKASIAAVGLVHLPCVTYDHSRLMYRLVDGFHRLVAMKTLNWKKANFVVLENGEDEEDEEEVWIDRQGNRHKLEELEDSHLINIIAMLERRIELGNAHLGKSDPKDEYWIEKMEAEARRRSEIDNVDAWGVYEELPKPKKSKRKNGSLGKCAWENCTSDAEIGMNARTETKPKCYCLDHARVIIDMRRAAEVAAADAALALAARRKARKKKGAYAALATVVAYITYQIAMHGGIKL